MKTRSYFRGVHFVVLVTLLALISGGCGSLTTPRVSVPKVDPQSAAAEAIRLYDKDQDANLDEAELKACPAIAIARYDANRDRRVSQEEIAQRLQQIYSAGIGVMEVHCSVTRGGRPLEGATVRFVPEPFLGDAVQPASGTSDASGAVSPTIPVDQLPENLRGVSLMQAGLYRVEIEHPSLSGAASKQFGFEMDPTSREGAAPQFNL